MISTIEMQPVDAPATERPARMSDELLRQYGRNITKRPPLRFAALVLLPFVNELPCRILGAGR